MEEKYYFEFDEEYETIPYRIYKVQDHTTGLSIEIAKAYTKEDANDIVHALNTIYKLIWY